MPQLGAVAIIEIVAAAATTAVAVYGAVQAGKAQSASAKYNSDLAAQNAKIAQQQGAEAAAQQQRQEQQKLGTEEAAYGASGVDASQGSALDVLTDSVRQGTLDNLTLKYNYSLKAAGYTDNASLDTFQAHNALTSSYMEAGGDLASGASKAVGDYSTASYRQQQYGSGAPVDAQNVFGAGVGGAG